MPNWVFNNIYITSDTPEEIESIVEFVNGETCFDFNKIIPRPAELDVESGGNKGKSTIFYLSKHIDMLDDADFVSKLKRNIPFESWRKQDVINKGGGTKDEDGNLYKAGEQYVNNIINHGYATWYEWSINNWGTKWNACDPTVTTQKHEVNFSFDTAWSYPEPIIVALSKKFPNAVFEIYAEEESMAFAFDAKMKNGIEYDFVDRTEGVE